MTYFDAASTVPLHPAAREALLAAVDDGWADPARLYRDARRARMLLDAARESIATAVGARADELSFTPSGSLANHLAILGTTAGRHRVGTHVVASAVEHSSVLRAIEHLGAEATTVGVDRTGQVDASAVASALRPDTAVASLQSANHEVGTRQPVRTVSAACVRAGVPLHVDAAQSVGREPVDVEELGAALLTASAHKWGGPAGVGLLVVRRGTRWRSPWPADEREAGRVPGFENVPGVLAAAAALEARLGEMESEASRLSQLVDRIRSTVPETVPDVEVVGHPTDRLPHIVTFSCLYIDGEALLTELDRRGFAVSSGSSCTASTLSPSHVLEAMGVLTHGNVRVSLHRETTRDDVDAFLAALPDVVAQLRANLGAKDL